MDEYKQQNLVIPIELQEWIAILSKQTTCIFIIFILSSSTYFSGGRYTCRAKRSEVASTFWDCLPGNLPTIMVSARCSGVTDGCVLANVRLPVITIRIFSDKVHTASRRYNISVQRITDRVAFLFPPEEQGLMGYPYFTANSNSPNSDWISSFVMPGRKTSVIINDVPTMQKSADNTGLSAPKGQCRKYSSLGNLFVRHRLWNHDGYYKIMPSRFICR